MSLDVYLMHGKAIREGGSGIYIRDGGRTREITRAEWDEKFPGCEPIVATHEDSGDIFHANITHNLGRMAEQAGIYMAMWRPDEIGVEIAAQIIEPLEKGLELLRSNPDRFKAFNPENGWGDYDGLVQFAEEYLEACRHFPDARVYASR